MSTLNSVCCNNHDHERSWHRHNSWAAQVFPNLNGYQNFFVLPKTNATGPHPEILQPIQQLSSAKSELFSFHPQFSPPKLVSYINNFSTTMQHKVFKVLFMQQAQLIRSPLHLIPIAILKYTGRFIMFSAMKNIYNKKTKWSTSMELSTATGKLKKFFFWQLEMFDVCTTGDTAHIDTIFKFLPHTRQHRYSSLLKWSVPLGQRGHVSMVGRILCTKCTLHSNHRLTVWYSNTQNGCSPGAAIFSLQTLPSPSGRNGNYDGKQLTEKKIWIVPSICTCSANTCIMVFL